MQLTMGDTLAVVAAEAGVTDEVLAAFEEELGGTVGRVTLAQLFDVPSDDLEETLRRVFLQTTDG
eukprot:1930220-Amphidinium_carterae.1